MKTLRDGEKRVIERRKREIKRGKDRKINKENLMS